MSESVILLIDILYAKATVVVNTQATLSASSSELIWILDKINSEAKV
jgi:hypothetical protein